MVKLDAAPNGGISADAKFFLEFDTLRGIRSAWKAATLFGLLLLSMSWTASGRGWCCSSWARSTASTQAWDGFAVALGLQERRRATVFRALVPIALGMPCPSPRSW